jgi:transcriptional regulator with XRE-family HTH domain
MSKDDRVAGHLSIVASVSDGEPTVVLGEVLRRAREGLNRSPEQVGALVGISGRTVRRLESGDADRPRRVTLDALAGFYGLNADAVAEIAEYELDPPAGSGAFLLHLRERVTELLGPGVAEALEGVEQESVELAMRLARLSGRRADAFSPDRARAQAVISYLRGAASSSPREHAEAVQAFVDFLALDRGRRALAGHLLHDLRQAQDAEQRSDG